jgi:hypothetical protein
MWEDRGEREDLEILLDSARKMVGGLTTCPMDRPRLWLCKLLGPCLGWLDTLDAEVFLESSRESATI